MSATTTITADGTSLIESTDQSTNRVLVLIDSAADLGSGTLALGVRPTNTEEAYKVLSEYSSLAAGEQHLVYIGQDMDVALTLSGSTSPNIPVTHTKGS